MRFLLGCAVLCTIVVFSSCNVNEQVWGKIRNLSATQIQRLGRRNGNSEPERHESQEQQRIGGGSRYTHSRARNSEIRNEDMHSGGYLDIGTAIGKAMQHQDTCQPRMRGVRVAQPTMVGRLYWPEHVKLDRCGDCCPHGHECSPSSTRQVKVTVLELEASINADPIIIGYKELDMESHPACECRCQTKREDCNSRQTYNAFDCSCTCKQRLTCSGPQVWDSDECACVCPNEGCCHAEEALNYSTCRCEVNRSVLAPIQRATQAPSEQTTRAPRQRCRRRLVCKGRGRRKTCSHRTLCRIQGS